MFLHRPLDDKGKKSQFHPKMMKTMHSNDEAEPEGHCVSLMQLSSRLTLFFKEKGLKMVIVGGAFVFTQEPQIPSSLPSYTMSPK